MQEPENDASNQQNDSGINLAAISKGGSSNENGAAGPPGAGGGSGAGAGSALVGLDALSTVAATKKDADVDATKKDAETDHKNIIGTMSNSNPPDDDDSNNHDVKMEDSYGDDGDDDDEDDDDEDEDGGTFMNNTNGAAANAGGAGGKTFRREESSGALDDDDDDAMDDDDDDDNDGDEQVEKNASGAVATDSNDSGSGMNSSDDDDNDDDNDYDGRKNITDSELNGQGKSDDEQTTRAVEKNQSEGNNNTGSVQNDGDSSAADDEKITEDDSGVGDRDGDVDDDYKLDDDDENGGDEDGDAMNEDTDMVAGDKATGKKHGESGPSDTQADPGHERNPLSSSPPSTKVEPKVSTPHQKTSTSSSTEESAVAVAPGPPVLKGRLFYDLEGRRHFIKGMWNFQNASEDKKLRFDLSRNLRSDEDPKELPKDGEFHGSFSNRAYIPTKKGTMKEKVSIVNESGVQIKFTKAEDEVTEHGHVYIVEGTGTNPFGTFSLNGRAVPSPDGDDQYIVELQKAYPTIAIPAAPASEKKLKKKKGNKSSSDAADSGLDLDTDGAPPPPSPEYPTGVVCQRGKVTQDSNDELGGLGESVVITKIEGTWAIGLDIILADPNNESKQQGRFVLEHKGSEMTFPVSGRYSGYFMYLDEKITEKDVTLRFRKNDAGYYNVEGKGSNRTTKGKYTVSGTLKNDNTITMFRMFPAKKPKAPKTATVPHQVTSAPPPINPPGQSRRPSVVAVQADVFSLGDVDAPNEGTEIEPFVPPENGNYAAVTRGVLREDEDGSFSCSGKWAQTRENLSANGQSSMCNLRLEAHFVQDAKKKLEAGSEGEHVRSFPLDSDQYKGSFELKRLGGRPQKVIDRQIVMKFRQTSQGMYNVYGKGINEFGTFNLTGTLVIPGKSGGQIELYRYYPPELLTPAATMKPAKSKKTVTAGLSKSTLPPVTSKELAALNASSSMLPSKPQQGIGGRRESTRMSKVPSRLEDNNPEAKLARTMEKCMQLLKTIEDKDLGTGAFFKAPVDPVALKIPNYYQIIAEPMDLETLRRKMEAGEVETPEEFCRLCRLIFENAIKFNVDPTHNVHRVARQMLAFFNQRFQSVMGQSGLSGESGGKKGGKDTDKKRKRDAPPEIMTPKLRRIKEAQEMRAENERCVAALVSAAPLSISTDSTSVPVSRHEFNLMLNMIQKLQQQIVKTHTALADLSSDAPEQAPGQSSKRTGISKSALEGDSTVAPPLKKKTKKNTEMIPKTASKPTPTPAPALISDEPLTQVEQEWLTNQINEMTESESKIHDIVEIIRSSDNFQPENEEEIDLEIDQLDYRTQRKLLAYAKENIAKSKKQTAKAGRKQSRKNSPKKSAAEPSPVAAAAPSYSPKAGTGGGKFFSFGNDGSDSESDGEVSKPSAPLAARPQNARKGALSGKDFRLGGLGDDDSNDDDDDDDGDDEGNFANWNIAKLEADTADTGGDEDDAWGAARSEAKAAKAREEDKKKREEKLQAEAEQQKNQRLAEAVAHGEEIKAMRQAEEEEEARLKEEKEREAEEERQKAREDARKAVQSVERTVDLDAERDLMKQLEQNYMGGASPSSDFGF